MAGKGELNCMEGRLVQCSLGPLLTGLRSQQDSPAPHLPTLPGGGVSSEEVGEGNHRPQSWAGVADEGPAVQASPGSCRVTQLEGSPGGRGSPTVGPTASPASERWSVTGVQAAVSSEVGPGV